MTNITATFTGDYNAITAQLDEYIDLLFALVKGGETTAQQRVDKTADITEAYYAEVGRHAPNSALSRLGSLIIYDILTDDTPYKVKNTEYPISSERQDEEYYRGLTMRKVPETIGTDGVDHRLPTRKYN